MAKDLYIKAGSGGGGGGVPTTRTLTINGTAQDLSADRTWSVGDMLKSTYDTDNSGIVDMAELLPIVVRNSTGSTIAKGKVVYLSGATGNRPNALLAKADAEITSSKTIGMVIADIANNTDGYVAIQGTLETLDTSGFSAGDQLWLSASTAGGMVNTAPSEPNHTVFIGYVARVHPTQGRVVLAIQNGYELDELHGVQITSVADLDTLYYDSATGLWKNRVGISVNAPTGSGATKVGVIVSGSNTNGGANYLDFLKATNTAVGATNINKYFRLNSTGGIEIVNSAYSGVILTLTDSGVLNGATATEMGYLSGVTSAIQTQLNAKGKYVLTQNLNNTTIAIGTTYIGIGVGSTNTAEVSRRNVVMAGTCLGCYMRITAAQTGTGVFTVYKNGSATSMTFTIANGSAAGVYKDVVNTFSVADYDELSIQLVQSTSTSTRYTSFGLIMQST